MQKFAQTKKALYICVTKEGEPPANSKTGIEKMNTTTSTISAVLENAFIIKRKGTKHRNDFSYNSFERPITHLDFFQLLNASNINLTSFEAAKYMCYIKATDYLTNWKGEATLVIASSYVQIVIKGAEWLNIYLDRSKFIEQYKYFQDQSLFSTDFGDLKHSEQYYK